MAGGLVIAEAGRLLNTSLNGIHYQLENSPSFVALTTSHPDGTTPGTEVAVPRVQAAFNVPAGSTTAQNSLALNFTAMPQTTVVAIDVYDAATGGNRRWWADLSQPRGTISGDTISFAINNISFSLA